MRHAPPRGPRTLLKGLTAALFVGTIALSVPLNAPAAQAGTNPPPATTSCSTVVSSKSALVSAVNSAANGSVVCVTNGSYGTVTFGAKRSGWVTVRSQNPQGAVFDEIAFDDAAYIRLEKVRVKGRVGNSQDNSHHIQVAGSVVGSVWAESPAKQFSGPGPSDWVIEYNDIPNCASFCIGLVSESPSRYWPVSNITVRGNKIGPMAGGEDAIRIHNWRNLTIENNEIFGVIENGQHNDCLQSVWGGTGIRFAGNYLHDNNCQTFFLKDGYTENIVVENNLSVRNRAGSAPVVAQIWPSRNVTIRNNTFWDDSGFYVRNGTYSSMFTSGPMTGLEVSNNVMDEFLPYDDNQPTSNQAGIFKSSSVMREDYNVFGGGWSWVPSSMGSHSVKNTSPSFVRTSSNRSQDLAHGDWRLSGSVSQGGATYTAGITWKLAGRKFGIEAYGLPPFNLGSNNVSNTFPSVYKGVPGGDSPGLVDPTQGRWWITDVGSDSKSFYFGNPGDLPFMGDWNCDGIDTPGLYRQSDGYVYLRNSNTQGNANITFYFGNPGDVPLAGDFNGDGCDTVGLYRPSEGRFFVINALGAAGTGLGKATTDYLFGNPGDVPFSGDFDGDGIDTFGLYRTSTGSVYMRNTHTNGIAHASFIYGNPNDRFVTGDWNADGRDSPGVFRPSTHGLYVRYHNSAGNADVVMDSGSSALLPVAGYVGDLP